MRPVPVGIVLSRYAILIPQSPTARPARSRAACLTVLLHILALVAAVRCVVLMPTIDVVGKRHINTSKAE